MLELFPWKEVHPDPCQEHSFAHLLNRIELFLRLVCPFTFDLGGKEVFCVLNQRFFGLNLLEVLGH